MKCYLSGMPELRLGLNDKAMFESTGRSESVVLIRSFSYTQLSHILPEIPMVLH